MTITECPGGLSLLSCDDSGSGGSGVTQIVAGTNVTISPVGGTGIVTVNSSGGVTTLQSETGDITLTSSGGTVDITTPSGTSINLEVSGLIQELSFAMPIVANTTGNNIALDAKSAIGYTIDQIRGLATSSGTCTVAIQINGTNVTSLSSLSVTSTPQDVTATGANTVVTGDRVSLVITSNSAGLNLEFTLKTTST